MVYHNSNKSYNFTAFLHCQEHVQITPQQISNQLEQYILDMTYSPSPSSPTAGTGSGLHLTQRSPTPPQPISKRDKRRNQHIAYQQDLENEFNQNRDHHFRAQLLSLQYDMNAITQADPYNPEPLEDSPDEIARMMSDAAVGTPYFSEVSSLAGKYYQEFVHEVNDAKEARDLALIQLQVRNSSLCNTISEN